MSEKSNMDTISKFVEEFKNKANHAIVDELFADDFVHHLTDPRLPEGREAMKMLGQMVVAAFPDVHATVEDLIVSGDKVIERTTTKATHKGEFNGVPATGNSVGWTEIHIYNFVDGKIAEMWSEIDFLGIMMQIGAIPST